MAPDIVVWHEMSPVKNALIENCTFRKCGFVGNNEANAVISVKTSHDGSQQAEQPIHSNITVRNNVFKDVRNKAIYMSSVDGFDIQNNDFDGKNFSETVVLKDCTP